jgi:hypothetical protein
MAKKSSEVEFVGRQFRKFLVEWTGLKPLVMHNVRLANPYDPMTRKVAELVQVCKKDPTDKNLTELIHAEWLGGLYLDGQQRPVVMSNAIRACIAQKAYPMVRGGKDAVKAAITVLECPLVEHGIPGVRTAKELWDHSVAKGHKNLLYVPVSVNNSVVMRSRPIFPEWKIRFRMTVNVGSLDYDTVTKLMDLAGDNGLLDYRPDYGQFVCELKPVEE